MYQVLEGDLRVGLASNQQWMNIHFKSDEYVRWLGQAITYFISQLPLLRQFKALHRLGANHGCPRNGNCQPLPEAPLVYP
jgi:hypothetical protein